MQQLIDFSKYVLSKTSNVKYEIPDLNSDLLEIVKEVEEYAEKKDDPYFIINNEMITSLFGLSWLEEMENDDKKLEYYLIGLFLHDCMNIELYRSVIQELFSVRKNIDELSVLLYWVFINKIHDSSSGDEFSFSSYLDFSRLMGFNPILPSVFTEQFSQILPSFKVKVENVNKEEQIEKSVKNLTERREYVEEISNYFDNTTLPYLDQFVEFITLNQLSYNIAKNQSNKIELKTKTSIAEFQKKIEMIYQDVEFPVVPTTIDPVLKPHLTKIDAKSVQMDKLATLPKELINEFVSSKAYSSPSIAHKIRITFLGGGGIGKMGIVVQHDNNAILLDFGMSVANNAIPRWHPSLQFVKAVIVSHAHLDHSGGLPYLINSENDKRWYGSPTTKILVEKLLYNTAYIIKEKKKQQNQFTPVMHSYLQTSNLVNLFNAFHPLKPKKTIEVAPGFEVTPYPASHLFGSYGYEINIFGKRIFFTGDFSSDSSELFSGAKFPKDCDLTIFDGTYYNGHIPEEDPNTQILQAVERNKRIIIPAFSVGRTQEMIKRLDRLGISKKRRIITTGLAAEITKIMGVKAEYDIKKGFQHTDFEENDIVIAGHGMLQGGTARTLLDATKEDEKTGIILCGYQAPNTLGYALRTSHPLAKQQFRQDITSAHISGHTTPSSLNEFISKLEGKKVMIHTPRGVKTSKKHKEITIPNYLDKIVMRN
ncbi:MAG: MBL fold metallo-hydrolase [Candidatus Heimdallarchaeota archaeon]|nr:MBL fold metallo-hydrolase [Candidatus Heimdallarchaeota archaeon]MCK4770140.1 MBL fold metallo-hydrolase [Candidatus Heimdallarchaeota archaeon]